MTVQVDAIPSVPLKDRRLPLWVNAVVFQLFWFVCVLADEAVVLVVTLLYLAFHHHYFVRRRTEWLLIFGFALLGGVFDATQMWLGHLMFADALSWAGLQWTPVWLLCLWLGFNTTLGHSFAWFNRKPWLASLIAFLCVPMTYYGGAMLSDSVLILPLRAWIWEGLGWALLFPLGLRLAARLA